jgi:hypothetical protein
MLTRELLTRNILNQYSLNVGAEIGTFKGQFSKHLLENWHGKLFMIDVWRGLGDEYIDSSNHNFFENGVYGECMKNIQGHEDRAIMIRASSEIASKIFNNHSLDFVYIDANHAYEFVKQDIELWYPKVKPGGWIMGHDYLSMSWDNPPFAENGVDKHIWVNDGNGGPHDIYAGLFGVNPAVDEFCKNNNYVVNLTEEVFFRTWYFQKKF